MADLVPIHSTSSNIKGNKIPTVAVSGNRRTHIGYCPTCLMESGLGLGVQKLPLFHRELLGFRKIVCTSPEGKVNAICHVNHLGGPLPETVRTTPLKKMEDCAPEMPWHI